ncbi:hypothetical protein M0R45_002432 [Rubus argutus]|uniref:Uncharacterized protein n=1 Tax=Rubus argutus TaxID=59490 RepID=A0AAW1VRL9_RUBAR
MGSDRKSEEKKKSRKRRSSSASEDEGKGKRQRTVEDEDRKSRKSDRKEKSKDKKRSHKHHSDKEKKSKDKHKSKHHKGDRHLNIEIQELSGDDYFSKNNEFSTWLKEEKDVFFSDLSAESSRKLFSDFVKAWNKRKLESRYYEGIATAPRSAHNWKIKG